VSDNLREAGVIVGHLNRALLDGSRDLETVPSLVERIIEDGMWEQWVDASGRRMPPSGRFRSFHEFVATAAARGGLGAKPETLYRLCPNLTDRLDKAFGRKTRTDKITDNLYIVQDSNDLEAPAGNSKRAALRRLRKDRPDLHAKVLAREISANWAMVEAKFRPRTITIPVTRPDAVARSLLKHMSADDIAQLIAVLIGAGDGKA
jgi:hypothetical protein